MSPRSRENYWFFSLLGEHPALVFSIVYVVASSVGMFFSWDYLRHFGINVFNYAQLSDFLLASLKEPMTWVIVALSVFMMFTDNALGRRWQRKARPRWLRWYGTERYRKLNLFLLVVIVVYLIDVWVRVKVELTLKGRGEYVEVVMADTGQANSALLLGTTSQFLFLYQPESSRATAHPFEAIRSISMAVDKPE